MDHVSHPPLSREEWFNAVTHGIGCLLGILGLGVLAWLAGGHGDIWRSAGVWVFGLSLVILYGISTAYHVARDPARKRRLRVLDHVAIFLLIAGTYTPLLMVNLRGPLGWTLLAVVWGMALAGIILKLRFTGRFGLASTLIYIGMGWLVVVAIRPLAQAVPSTGMALLLAGGLSYTGGTVFYMCKRIPYHHGLWHLSVLGGSVCHYFAIMAALF